MISHISSAMPNILYIYNSANYLNTIKTDLNCLANSPMG